MIVERRGKLNRISKTTAALFTQSAFMPCNEKGKQACFLNCFADALCVNWNANFRKFHKFRKLKKKIKSDLMPGYHVLECCTGKLRDIEDTFPQIDV